MNFHLKDLQLHFDISLIEEAETLIASGDLQKISEIKKDLWQLKFDYDGATCQCQINPAGKVRKYTCTCVVYSLYKKCRHVATICMLIQKIRLNAVNINNQGVNQYQRSIPLGKILQHTTQIELINFLLEYSKTSPEITNALKARFIFNYPEEIRLENDPILTVQVEKFLTAKRPGENTLFDIYKSFDAYFIQSDAKINQHETLASFNILTIIGKNIFRLLDQNQSENPKIIEKSKLWFSKLLQLYRLFVAPEAKKQLTDLLLESQSLMFKVTDIDWHEKYAELMLYTVTKEYEYQSFKTNILNLGLYQIPLFENRSNWIMYTIQSDLIRGEKPDFEMIVPLMEHNIDLFRSLLSRLINKLQYDLVIKFIQHVHKSNGIYFKNYENELNTILLDMFIRTKNWKKAESLLIKTYPVNPNSQTLNFIKEQFPEHFQELWDKLRAIKLADNEKQLELELSFSELTQDFSGPMNTIIQSNDIKLLVKYDQLFWSTNPTETVELYKSLSKHYLETHFGEPAQNFIRQMFRHLDQSKHREESKIIKKFLNNLFSDRNLLETKFQFPVI